MCLPKLRIIILFQTGVRGRAYLQSRLDGIPEKLVKVASSGILTSPKRRGQGTKLTIPGLFSKYYKLNVVPK